MSNASYGDAAVTKIRAAIASVDEALKAAPPTPTLQKAWGELVELLALGPEPATRECPTCKSVGFRDASRCSNCWATLGKLPALPAVVQPGVS